MKKLLLFICVLILQMSFSQVTFEGNKLIKNGQTYKLKEYKEVFDNQEAENYFKKARNNSNVGNVFAAVGGGFVGYGLARALSGGNKTVNVNGSLQKIETKGWGAVGIGAGLIGVAIPFVLSANKNAKKAIVIENGETSAFQPYLKLETAGDGLALSYNF